MNTSKCVIAIVGMHRSGTSLTAKWLNKAGLNLGKNLLGPNLTNPAGHYEDLDFLQFHTEILNQNGLDYLVDSNTKKIQIQSSDFSKAREIVNVRNNESNVWGWKEPRTCLFLNFWKGIIPDLKIIVVYRNHHEIVSSLIKRELQLIENSNGGLNRMIARLNLIYKRKELKNRYLKVTNHYNCEILNTLESIPAEDYIVTNVESLINSSIDFLQLMNDRWMTSLNGIEIKEIMEPDLFKRKSSPYKFLPILEKESQAIQSRFNGLFTKI